MRAIFPCIWLNGQAKEAAAFYTSIFPNASILQENDFVSVCRINGHTLMCLNGGPQHQPNEGVSLVVECDTQEEIDHLWSKLSEGGREDRCGWLQDKFHVSWQIVPVILGQLMSDPERAPRVVNAFMQMTKFEIKKLEEA